MMECSWFGMERLVFGPRTHSLNVRCLQTMYCHPPLVQSGSHWSWKMTAFIATRYNSSGEWPRHCLADDSM